MKDRLTIKELADTHCCGTCFGSDGEFEDNEQFCDELEAYVNAREFCCNRWQEKLLKESED